MFTITSPARGAMLLGGTLDTSSVTVTGTVCDPSASITSLTLNGSAIQVSGTKVCESFSVPVVARWGLTIITGEARNEQGRTTRLASSFLRGPAYFPPADSADVTARVPRGVAAQLDATGLNGRVNDIAGRYFNTIEWNRYSPRSPAWGNVPSLPYTVNCLLVTQPGRTTGWSMVRSYDIPSTSDGVQTFSDNGNRLFFFVQTSIDIPLQVSYVLDQGCAGWTTVPLTNGWAGATYVSLGLSFGLEITNLGPGRDTLRAVAPDRVTGYTGSYFDFALAPGASLLATWLTVAAQGVDGVVQRTAQGLLAQVQPAMEQLFSGLAPLPPAAAPSPGFLPVSVSRPDSLRSDLSKFSVTSTVQLYPAAPRPGSAPSRGALRRDGTAPSLQGSPFITALKDDVVNQYFWAAWRGGALDGTGALVPQCRSTVSGAALLSYALLPPVLMTDTGRNLTIGLGDLKVSGTVPAEAAGGTGAPISLELFASSVVRGTMDVRPGSMTISHDSLTELRIEITAVSDSAALDALPAALTPYVDCLARTLTRLAVESVPLPGFRPPSLPGVSSTPWRPASPVIERSGSYIVVRGGAN